MLSLALIAFSILTFIDARAFNALTLPKIIAYISSGKVASLAAYAAVYGATIAGLIAIGMTQNWWMRTTWLMLILLSATVAQLSLLCTGTPIRDQTIEIFWNARFSSDSFLMAHWVEVLMSFSSALWMPLGLYFFPSRWRHPSRILYFVPGIPLIATFLFLRETPDGSAYGVPPHFAPVAVLSAWYLTQSPPIKKGPLNIAPTSAGAIEHIILIVDESIRADFLDLNGSAGVTPFLATQHERIVNFGRATSGNNCTATSNAFLRLGYNPRLANGSEDPILAHPSIWKYASEAGYRAGFFDNQRTIGQLQNYMDQEERALIEDFEQFSTATSRRDRDQLVVQKIARYQKLHPRTFIYLNKAGAHVPYQNSYPTTWALDHPHLALYEPARDRTKMINSYRNAVRWSVDEFFRTLLPAIDLTRTVIVYTSDHGQNLLDDGTSLTHCHIRNPRPEEALVPLLVMTNNPALRQRFATAALHQYHQASHFQIFPTILTLFGYRQQTVEDVYFYSLFTPLSRPIGFTSSEIVKRFGSPQQWTKLDWHQVDFR